MTSASTNSALAAVLAGLLIATIAVMFNRPREQHTIALFATGVVVLALDSYLFSHVTGIRARSDNPLTEASQSDINTACERAWVQGISASGLLVTGGITLTCGLAWMMATYIAESTGEGADNPALPRLAGVLVAFVVMITTLLLVSTAYQYLQVLTENLDPKVLDAQERLDTWRIDQIKSQSDGSLTLKQLVLPAQGAPKELEDAAKPSTLNSLFFVGALVSIAATWVPSLLSICRSTRQMMTAVENRTGTSKIDTETPRLLSSATFFAGLYALLGPGFAGVVSLNLDLPRTFFIVSGLVIGVFYPLGIAILLSCSLPRPKPAATLPPHQRGSSPSGAVTAALVLIVANIWRS
jgi:hypothetical protein